MEKIIDVAYSELQERPLPVIISEIKTIEAHVYKTTLDGVIEIGKRLEEAKEQVSHGEWEDWCEKNLNYSSRQARKYIEISSKYGDENSPFSNRNTYSDLSISKAYSLLKVPEDELESFAENVDLENISVKELEDEIRRLKEEKKDIVDEKLRIEIAKVEAEEKLAGIENSLKKQIADLESDLENHKAGDPVALEAKEAEIQKLKDKLKSTKVKIEAEKAKAAEEATAKAAEDAKKKFEEETKLLRESNAEAAKEIDRLQRSLQNNSQAEIAIFKVKSDLLQESFNACLASVASVETEDPEKAGKMRQALKTVMEQLILGI